MYQLYESDNSPVSQKGKGNWNKEGSRFYKKATGFSIPDGICTHSLYGAPVEFYSGDLIIIVI
jgi:hypothetical protein